MILSTLYKILTNRKYIVGLLIGFIGSISFGYCATINNSYLTISSTQTKSASCNGFCCFSSDSSYARLPYTKISYGNVTNFDLFNGVNNSYPLTCLEIDGNFSIYNGAGSSINVIYWDITNLVPSSSCPSCPECPTCPEINTGEILSGYVPETDLITCQLNYNTCENDLNTCQSNTSGFNNLLNNCNNDLNVCNNSLTNCLQQNCPETITGINRSTLFINNIQYPGAPTIKFTIPEEIERDQNTDEEEINIDVIGYGYDQDKMQQMVNTQYYKPTAEEMSGLIEKVAEFLPLVAVALLIARIRRVIKKVF